MNSKNQLMESMPTPSADVQAASSASARPSRSALSIVFLVVFIDLLGFGLILPLLPRIADEFVRPMLASSGSDPADAERISGFITGGLMASFSLMQFLFAPGWGRLSDRNGRRPILLVGLMGSVASYSLFGFAASLDPSTNALLAVVLFFVSRIGAGIAGATISTAQAVIADTMEPEKRKHGMALIGAAFGIGFTFGPLIGFGSLSLTNNYYGSIGFVAAGLSFIAFLLGVWLLPETRRFDQASSTRKSWIDLDAFRYALNSPALAPVVLTFFMATIGFGMFETTLALLLKDAFQFEEGRSYWIFAYVGFVLMLTQGGLYRPLAKRMSEVALMGLGMVLMGTGVGTLGLVTYFAITLGQPMFPLLYVALTCSVVGFAFLTPSAQALVSRRTPLHRQGEILGVNQSCSAMARILGPLIGIPLYKYTDSRMLPYLVGAALLLLMVPMLPRIAREKDAPPAGEPAPVETHG